MAIEMNTSIDNGIEAETRAQIAVGLARLLADTYTLYLKTHNGSSRLGGQCLVRVVACR